MNALSGLSVIDLSSTLTGAHVTGLLADFGADVVMVERPGGHPLRAHPAWPFWGRGKRSIVLDLKEPADAAVASELAASADVVVETWRPGVAERLGLGYDALSKANPGLVYASVTGFGRDSSWSNLKAYEAVVMAKIGGLDAYANLTDRPGPAFVASPICAFSASQLALQGVLSALCERESSGQGQKVESTLVQGILAHDTWNWVLRLIASRYSDAFSSAPPVSQDELVPNSPLFFRLMVGFSADGRYMQFSQTTERLWQAFMRAMGLDWMLSDPEWKDAPAAEDPRRRVAFWERLLAAVRSKTYDDWLEVFDEEPDVWAEIFRHDSELLHHPQMIHDRRTVTIDDPRLGPVTQPGPMVGMGATPARLERSAPSADQHGADIRGQAGAAEPHSNAPDAPMGQAPLAGVTIVELGTFYAAPFGATLLADMGARVIKIEQPDGEPMRSIMPFPEAGGIKVLQGKESVAVNMTTEAGREIVLALVRKADIVLQTFRAGVAERHGYTAEEMLAVNPDLIYVSAPGYGSDGPCGHRPAFAPTIGAGSGFSYRNVGGVTSVPQGAELTLEETKRYAMRMSTAGMGAAHADGFAALGVGTALLLGLLAKRRGAPGQVLSTSMLSTMAHTLSEEMIEYRDRASPSVPDPELYGLSARYRLYETADGWVFLAAVNDKDWTTLAAALDLDPALAADDDKLVAVLTERFGAKPARAWEEELTALDVACVEVAAGPVEEAVFFGGGIGRDMGIVTETTHEVIGEYSRLTPLVRYSRSAGVAGPAPLLGAHTDGVLGELGYSAERIGELRASGVLA